MDKPRQSTRLARLLADLVDRARRHALPLMSTVPFVLLIVGAVGTVGYLSFRNAQEAIGDLANQLMAEVGQRVDQHLSGLLDSLEQITRGNAALVRGGKLDPGNRAAVVERLSEQLGQYQHVNTVALASERRDFTALERDPSSLILREFDRGTKLFTSRRLTTTGERGEVTGVIENYDPHQDPPHDPWYTGAKAHQGSFWFLAVSVARGLSDPDLMIINFLPIYDDRQQVLGVTAASTFLTTFGQFLTRLRIGRNGQVFVIDKEGKLVATSSGEEPFRHSVAATYAETAVQDNKRLAAVDSSNPLTAASAKAVLERVGALDRVVESRQFMFQWEKQAYFLQIVPIRRGNLDWLTVILVPEAHLMARINQGTHSSVLLAILALLGAVVAGAFTARWIVQPIMHLNAAAKGMARGEWNEPVAIDRSDAIGELAASFNDMSRQLKVSFETLEQRVRDRTADLARSNENLAAAKDAAEAANRAKSVFLATMSHELRTPLNAILGFSNLMRRAARARQTSPSAEQREHLDIIHKSGEHLLDLINEVLDLSKIEAGRAIYHPTDCDLHALLRGLRELFGQRASDKRLSLHVQWPPETPRYVRTDEAKLRQVLINLLGNALKFTAQGEVQLVVTREAETKDGTGFCRLRFAVTDTGPGIAPDERAWLFRPFAQTRTGLKTQGGTGLGLAISREYVRLLGGEIDVESELGRGSQFAFELELVASDEAPPVVERIIAGLAPDQPRHRVLVVDDQEFNRRLLVQILEPLGFELAEAADGEAALEQWRIWRPDLLWLDLRMPGLDGHAVARRIRAEEPDGRTRLLAVSASAFAEEREQVLASGCDDFLRKPFGANELLEMMGRHLGLQFVYVDEVPQSNAPSSLPVVGPERLLALPELLRRQLHDAALCLDRQRVAELANRIAALDPELGAWVLGEIHELRFDRLLDFLDGAVWQPVGP